MPNLHPQIQGGRSRAMVVKLDLEADRGDGPGRGGRRWSTWRPRARRCRCRSRASTTARSPARPARCRVRIYTPPGEGARPAIVYYHRRRPCRSAASTLHDLVARNPCGGAEAVVVSVDYRRWGLSTASPPRSRICSSSLGLGARQCRTASAPTGTAALGVHGDSAGANLAAVVALHGARPGSAGARLQSLVYPVADFRMATESYKTYAGVTGCGILDRRRDEVVPQPLPAADGRRADLARPRRCWRRISPASPRRLIIAAEQDCDVLHDEGRPRARGCKAAGVPAERHEYAAHDPRLLRHDARDRRRDERPTHRLGRVQKGVRLG